MSNEIAWRVVLDAFEARLDAQADALALGAPGVVPAFVAPVLPNPLPDTLLDRATALVWRCRELEDALSEALQSAEASLAKVHDAAPAPAPAQPVYFDSRV